MNKILIVDHDRSIRELLQLHLSNAGYEALVAEDAIVARPPDPAGGARPDDRRSGHAFHERHRVRATLKADGRTRDIPGRLSRLDADFDDLARGSAPSRFSPSRSMPTACSKSSPAPSAKNQEINIHQPARRRRGARARRAAAPLGEVLLEMRRLLVRLEACSSV